QANLGATTVLRFFSSDILGTGSNFQGWQNYLEAPLFYIGLLMLLLAPQVFIYLDKRKKALFGAFAGFWLLTLLFPYLRYAILAFTGDYFRYGFDFFIPFTLLFYGIYALNEMDKTFKVNYKLLAFTLSVLIISLFFPYSSLPAGAIDNNLRLLIGLLLFIYTGIIVLLANPIYKQYGQIALFLIIIFELSYFSYKSYSKRIPLTKIEFKKDAGGYNDGTPQAVKYLKSIDNSLFYRCEKDYQSGSAEHGSLNDALAQGYYGTTSYSSFNQLNYVRFLEETGIIPKGDETATRWITGFRGNPLLLTFGNIKYFFSKSEQPEMLRFGFDSLSFQKGVFILKNRFYLPFGYTYDKYIDFDDYKTLIHYQITPPALNNLAQIFTRYGDVQIWEQNLAKLNTLTGIEFTGKEQFIEAIEQKLGKELTQKYYFSFLKFCVNNFENQIALLNAFVYDKNDIPKQKISGLEKISVQDTNIFIPPTKFNFKLYAKTTNHLKQDTFNITKFSQSNIEGKINLSKTKMLFFTIPFDEGWKVEVNGKEKELYRTNIGFTGIILPKGNYEIKLYFIPKYYNITNGISLVSIILFWIYLGYWIYRKKKDKH
ncbi:MAG: YfhO family protein, partial [Bacteroidales bacterium]|nr:YfhO family protein [Bacteroidales bacterium]